MLLDSTYLTQWRPIPIYWDRRKAPPQATPVAVTESQIYPLGEVGIVYKEAVAVDRVWSQQISYCVSCVFIKLHVKACRIPIPSVRSTVRHHSIRDGRQHLIPTPHTHTFTSHSDATTLPLPFPDSFPVCMWVRFCLTTLIVNNRAWRFVRVSVYLSSVM